MASIVECSQLDKYTLVPLTYFYTDYCIPTEHSYFYFSSPGLPIRAQKNMRQYLLNVPCTFNLGLNSAKNTHQVKKASNKSCSKLNFLQKNPGTHMSISPQSGARWLERLICLKYYFVLKRQNIFNLGLNPVKNTHQIRKIKIIENEISYKEVSRRAHPPPPGVQLGASKDRYVSNILLY